MDVKNGKLEPKMIGSLQMEKSWASIKNGISNNCMIEQNNILSLLNDVANV